MANERVNEDGFYVPRRDAWYYGAIPRNCTRAQLVNIMAKAIVSFKLDQHYQTSHSDTIEECARILDLWFQHDAEGDDEFDHLVPEEKFERFEQRVIAKAQAIFQDHE